MASHIEGPVGSFEAAGAIGLFLRVKDNGSGQLVVAVAADGPSVCIGQTEQQTFAAGDIVGVRLRNAPGTAKMVAKEAITANAPVFADVEGKIGLTGANPAVGQALEAAAADGDIIEVLRD